MYKRANIINHIKEVDYQIRSESAYKPSLNYKALINQVNKKSGSNKDLLDSLLYTDTVQKLDNFEMRNSQQNQINDKILESMAE